MAIAKKGNTPEVGDYVTQANWYGEYFKVLRVDKETLLLEYKDHAGRLSQMEYPLVNNWIFRTPKKDYDMEDTRHYLEVISGLSI